MDLKKYQSQLNNIQTPCYVYDLNLLEQTLLACKNAADQYNFLFFGLNYKTLLNIILYKCSF